MADPLSIVTSVLTLLGAGSQVASSFERILKLRNAPDVLLALRNEISDVCLFLEDVQDQLARCALENIIPPPSLARAIQRTQQTALEIQSFIAYDLVVVDSEKAYERIDKSRWLRAQPQIQELQTRMRSNKVDLNLGLITITLSSTLDDIRRNRRVTAFSKEFDSYMQEAMSNPGQHSSHQKGAGAQNRLPSESVADCSARAPTNSEIAVRENGLNPSSADVSQAFLSQAKNPVILQMASTKNCKIDCSCTCHKKKTTRTPAYLDRILGSIFLGYQAAPWFAQPCNQPLCLARSTLISYTFRFPRWFLSRVIQASLLYTHVQGPELILRVMRVRSLSDAPFSLIYQHYSPETESTEANTAMYMAVKSMIENAEASVLDVTSYGSTLLDCAIRAMNFELVEYLLRTGADPLYEADNGISPYMRAWREILSEPESLVAMALSKLFDQSHLSCFKFSRLHRAYLGLSSETFLSALNSIDRTEIDLEDTLSRTTLSWAAARGDQDTVSRLLACGADPNKQVRQGRTPFYWAAASSAKYECMSQLVRGKARADVRDRVGFTPLMHVARNDSPGKSKILQEILDASSTDSFCNSLLDFVIHSSSHQALFALLREGGLILLFSGWGCGIVQHVAKVADTHASETLLPHARGFAIDFAQSEQTGAALEVAGERRDQHVDGRDNPHFNPLQRKFEDPMNWLDLFEELAFNLGSPPAGGNISLRRVDQDATGEAGEDIAHRAGESKSSDDEEWQDARE